MSADGVNVAAKDVVEIMAILDLGVAVGTLTVVGHTEEEIIAIVKINIEKARESMKGIDLESV